jgi:predicted DCC family thiol-disulfide oxidoreductase YuxK
VSVSDDVLEIAYDGECPFCTRFVALYRIRRNVGKVVLTDVRERPDLLTRFAREGLDINAGMVVLWRGRTYHGADSVQLLALLSAEEGLFARINRMLFLNRRVAGMVYPLLVRGRKLTLRAMGRRLIETPRGAGRDQ